MHPSDRDPWNDSPVSAGRVGDTGAQLHVREGGAATGAPVVLLHRRGAAGDIWDTTLELGSGAVRLLAPDLPGRGLSDPVPGDVPEARHVLDALRRTEPRAVLLVADGDSADLAAEMALTDPGAVSGLVLLGPGEWVVADLGSRLRRVRVPIWVATGQRTGAGAQATPAEVPGGRWVLLPGVGDEPPTDHPDLVLDLVHGAVAELAAGSQPEPPPQAGRRYITWVSSDACVNPSLSR